MPAVEYTRIIADYISRLRYDSLPNEVTEQTKTVILDALGCQVACASLKNGRLIIPFARSMGGSPESTVLGSDYKTSALNAALINGTLGHGDEIDESLEDVGHVSATVIPAALACGERQKATGKEMIAAVVVGYDIAGRLADAGASMSGVSIPQGMGLTNALWAAATASNILKNDNAKTRIAFGLAGCQSGGYFDLGSEGKHMAKSLMCGIGARDGVTAALLASIGYDGPKSIFDGEQNIFSTVIGNKYQPEAIVRELGSKFTIMDTCIKLFSAGHPIHAAVDGLLKIMAREKIQAEAIKSITVGQPEREQKIVDNRDMPDINIQYCLAVTAFDGRLTWDQYKSDRLNDPRVLDLKKRITTFSDPEMDELKKKTRAHSARVKVTTYDGRDLSETIPYPPGDPGNPATFRDVEQKVLYYASKVIEENKARKLIETVKQLEDVADVNLLGELLRV